MDAVELYLTKKLRILNPHENRPSRLISENLNSIVSTFNRNLMSLGFVCSQELTNTLLNTTENYISDLYNKITPILKKMVGDHRSFKPFYPNFPKQVMDASELELYTNAMMHYWGSYVSDVLNVTVRYLPEYKVNKRNPLPNDEVNLKVINLGSEKDFNQIFTNLVGSNGSLSQTDKDIVSWFASNVNIKEILPSNIPQKENLAYLIGCLMKTETPNYLLPYLKTATDVLRVVVALSDGDVSLATPCKFRNLKRIERRFFLNALEGSFKGITEDMLRRPEVWKKLGFKLHPGDYGHLYPNTLKAFNVICNKEPFETFNGLIEKGIKISEVIPNSVLDVSQNLKSRPGDFARRLDHLLRISDPYSISNQIIDDFREVANKVSTPVLLQAYAHFKNRNLIGQRSFFPKGNLAKVKVSDEIIEPLSSTISENITKVIRDTLVDRFSKLPALGNVHLDDKLNNYLVPFAQRSASKALRTITRGSRVDLPNSTALRFFVWWKDGERRTDIDLASVFFNEDWVRLADISYYNLKQWDCAHSGDITSAPNGACEFIDIDIEKLLVRGVRYVQMVIYSYTEQAFKDLPECFAGWMGRSKVQSGEVFEGRTVQDKIDIAGDTTVNIPLIIDLKERKVIWSDIALKSRSGFNNSLKNGDNLARMGKAILNLHKPTLYDLFLMHTEARGIRVNDINADTVFSEKIGITPFDTDKIMKEYLE